MFVQRKRRETRKITERNRECAEILRRFAASENVDVFDSRPSATVFPSGPNESKKRVTAAARWSLSDSPRGDNSRRSRSSRPRQTRRIQNVRPSPDRRIGFAFSFTQNAFCKPSFPPPITENLSRWSVKMCPR